MRPLKLLNACMWQIQYLGILLMVTLPWIIALNEAEGDKTFNLKIGFDLTHGSQEASSAKLKNIKESHPAPYNSGEENHKRILRAQDTSSSISSSSEQQSRKEKSILKMGMKAIEDSSESEEDSDDSGSDRKQRSTKGLRPDEYEADARPAVREAFDKDSETENSN